MIFFTADTHFGHNNVIRFCDRPFSSAAEMDEVMIRNWNARVTGGDTVYILGDMFFRSTNAEEILQRLKGKKRLIVGNHDGSWMTNSITQDTSSAWTNFWKPRTDGIRSPCVTIQCLPGSMPCGPYMIHGHIHNDTSADFYPLIAARENVLNAGVDINGFRPVTFEELLENNRRFKKSSFYTCSL